MLIVDTLQGKCWQHVDMLIPDVPCVQLYTVLTLLTLESVPRTPPSQRTAQAVSQLPLGRFESFLKRLKGNCYLLAIGRVSRVRNVPFTATNYHVPELIDTTGVWSIKPESLMKVWMSISRLLCMCFRSAIGQQNTRNHNVSVHYGTLRSVKCRPRY